MKSMKSISERLQTAKEQASWEWFKSEYSGKELTPESFELMQQEINSQTEEAMKAYEESYVTALAAMYDMYMNPDSKQYDPELYNGEVLKANREKLDRYAELQKRGFEFELNTIRDTYGNRLDVAEIEAALDEAMQEALSYAKATGTLTGAPGESIGGAVYDAVEEILNEEFSEGDQLAIAQLLEGLYPKLEELEELKAEYIKMGMAIPEWIDEGLKEAAITGLAGGDEGYIDTYLANNKELKEFEKKFDEGMWTIFDEESDAYIHEQAVEAKEAMEREAAAALEEAAKNAREQAKRFLEQEFEAPIEISPTVKMNPFAINIEKKNPFTLPVEHKAEGGIVTSPILTTFAEEGPEAAIPLDGSSRALSLWRRAGEILSGKSRPQKAYDGLSDGSGGMNITYSPVMTFSGSASKEDVMEANRQLQEEFEMRMNRWMKNNRRVSFA